MERHNPDAGFFGDGVGVVSYCDGSFTVRTSVEVLWIDGESVLLKITTAPTDPQTVNLREGDSAQITQTVTVSGK